VSVILTPKAKLYFIDNMKLKKLDVPFTNEKKEPHIAD
jgi:hypothetical protein